MALIKPHQAMILAAGEGRRMHPLTQHTPKPLLLAGGKPLIVWHIERLVALGIQKIVINVRYLADKLVQFFDEHSFDAKIVLSVESDFVMPIETAAGIKVALTNQLLDDAPFLLINGDVWTNMPLAHLGLPIIHDKPMLAYLSLVKNPTHHAQGDFLLARQLGKTVGQVLPKDTLITKTSWEFCDVLTFSGVSVLSPRLFDELVLGVPCRLAPVLLRAMQAGQVMGEWQRGAKQGDDFSILCQWLDVGTPERLQQLNDYLADKPPVLDVFGQYQGGELLGSGLLG